MESRVYKTVSAAVAYDDPVTGDTFMLVIHQAIHMPRLSHNLLCPMQLRQNDVEVDERPKFLTTNPTEKSHAIVLTDEAGVLVIPLQLRGVSSYFNTRKPTAEEFETSEAVYDLTCNSLEWDPTSEAFAEQEKSMMNYKGEVRPTPPLVEQSVWQVETVLPHEASSHYELGAALESQVKIPSVNSGQTINTGATTVDRGLSQLKSEKRPKLEAPKLAERWGIGLQAAASTLRKTTQRGVRTVLNPSLSRRFRTNDRQLRYRRLPVTLYSDTMASTVKSTRQNRYAQIFYEPSGWTRAFPMQHKSDAHEALSLVFARDGVPSTMIVDNAKEQIQGKFKSKCREAGCHLRSIEPHSQWSNLSEGAVREVKQGTGRDMVKTGAPKRLWDYCLELKALQRSHTASSIFAAKGEVPETIVSGQTADISQLCEFAWYDWVKFRESTAPFPEDQEVLGRYLGPSMDCGPAMTAQILKQNGQVEFRSTYRPLTPSELVSELEIKARAAFDAAIESKLGEAIKSSELPADAITPEFELYSDESGETHQHAPEADAATPDTGADHYLNAEVLLPRDGDMVSGKVTGRKRDSDGNLTGTKHQNPILDTRIYEVEFPDGEVTEYAANVIAENMWTQCDEEGNQFLLLDAIVDWSKDSSAVEDADKYVTVRDRRSLRQTTKGWKLCAQWKDGSTSWERLSDLKESNPVEVAEFAIAQGLSHEPAFAWWVPHTIKKRSRIIAAVNKRFNKRQHKFGVRIPNSVREARELDKENGDTLWVDALEKEIKNVRVAFKEMQDDEPVPIGYEQITGHVIFDVKMEDFRRKARYVADGHKTAPPATLTYAGVVSRETVRIALTMAALLDLEVKTSDIQNAFLTAPNGEKCWIILGPEFGSEEGKRCLVVRALYGLRSAGASFRNHLSDCMRALGYKSCLADADLWMKEQTRPDDGLVYYSYMLLYIDDALSINHDPQGELERLDKYFMMKPGSIGDPSIYLGAKLKKVQLSNGVWAWGQSPSKYVQEAVRNVEAHLKKTGKSLTKRVYGPFPTGYSAELDTSPELEPEQASYYQSQIGILRWMVELGRVDIITEVSVLSSHLALPREGHLEAVFHIYAYLKKKHNTRMVFDPSYPMINEDNFPDHEWKNFYGEVKEAVPPNAPKPLGREVDLRLFVDSSHADDKSNRRSRSGYFVFLNSAPIAWLSKKQATIETAVFGAEFVAMKIGMEAVRGIRYKLRMMGIPISGPTFIYGDNMSVIHNTQRPESVLKKKNNAICYHAIRESVAMGESKTGHIPTDENVADLATKIIGGGTKRDHLTGLVLHDLTDHQDDDD